MKRTDFMPSRKVNVILNKVEQMLHMGKLRVHLYRSDFNELLAALPEEYHDHYWDGIPYENGVILRV